MRDSFSSSLSHSPSSSLAPLLPHHPLASFSFFMWATFLCVGFSLLSRFVHVVNFHSSKFSIPKRKEMPSHSIGSCIFKVGVNQIIVTWLVRFGLQANQEIRMRSNPYKPHCLRMKDRLSWTKIKVMIPEDKEILSEQMKLTDVIDIVKILKFFKVYFKWPTIMETFHLLNWMWFLPSLNPQSMLFVPLLWQLPLNCIIFISVIISAPPTLVLL